MTLTERIFRRIGAHAAMATLAVSLLTSLAARAEQDHQLQELVDRARFTLEVFNQDENMQQFRAYVPYAHALLIVPEYIKGAYFLGGASGRGVLIRRNEATGQWTSPAFYRLWSASLGLQVGGSTSEMVVIFQTERGVQELEQRLPLKFGLDASVAAGPRGYSAGGSTSPAGSTDIAAFAKVKGAFMGASMSGTSVVPREDWNHQYYGSPVSLTNILNGTARNPRAEALSQAAAKFFADNSAGGN
jgi:SH3 domain-containing YSC84-like protein 1